MTLSLQTQAAELTYSTGAPKKTYKMATHTDKDIIARNGVDFVIFPWKSDLVTPTGYDLTIGVAATITTNGLTLSMSGREKGPMSIIVPSNGKLLIL